MGDSGVMKVETLWYTRCPLPTASGIAIEQGTLGHEFSPDGIEVLSLSESTSRDVRESHFDHSQENSFREGGNTPAIWSRSRGADTRLIGVTWVDQYQAVVALPESGIRRPSDLAGRRIGVSHHVNDQIDFMRGKSLRAVLTSLELSGLTTDDVELIDLPEAETYLGDEDATPSGTLWSAKLQQSILRAEVFALVRGEVDAISVNGSGGAALDALLGSVQVVDLGRHPDREVRISNATPMVFTASGQLVRERPDLVRRYLETVRQAARWAEDNHRRALQIIARELGDAEEWVEIAYGEDLFASLEPSLNAEMHLAVENQKDFLLRHGFIEHDFDVGEWAAPELYD
jgi:ABC-type nitrate/sulfonate/bicarbonate transport system substrate-binding protein